MNKVTLLSIKWIRLSLCLITLSFFVLSCEKEDIEPAFRAALENKHRPTIIEFMIDPEDLVYPMIKPGGTLEELIMDC